MRVTLCNTIKLRELHESLTYQAWVETHQVARVMTSGTVKTVRIW